jgi:hypothetical protein
MINPPVRAFQHRPIVPQVTHIDYLLGTLKSAAIMQPHHQRQRHTQYTLVVAKKESPHATSIPPTDAPDSPEYREFIRNRLKKQQAFNRYLGVWSGVSILLLLIWFFTSPGGYFWPIWPILGMGISAFFQWREAMPQSPKKTSPKRISTPKFQRLKDQS